MDQQVEQWVRRGAEASAQRRHGDAIRAFEQALRLQPQDPFIAARLALEFLNQGNVAAARTAAQHAQTLPGADAKTLDMLGHVFSRTADFQEAVRLFRQAAQAAPDNVAILTNLAWGAQHVGHFDEAEGALRRALALAPDHDRAWFSLSGLPNWRPNTADITHLSRLFAAVDGDDERRLGFGHALARAQEAMGDAPAALDTLARAKAGRRRARRFDIKAALAVFDAAPKAWLHGPTGAGDPSDAPIFIVGPPRSGTTLLDRILSSHPQVTSAGELRAMPLLALRAAGVHVEQTPTAEILLRSAGAPAALIGQTYRQAAASLAGATPRFTDKRPFNLIFAGMISRALPNARILRMRRGAADTVLGNYRQLFAAGSAFHDYAYDLEDTAHYVAGMEALSAAWERLLPPDRYRVIDYEALVSDPEKQIRAALSFCGLDWDSACLDFHLNTEGVSTASAVQVREPLHDRNIGLWRSYGDGFEPALRILRDAGLET